MVPTRQEPPELWGTGFPDQAPGGGVLPQESDRTGSGHTTQGRGGARVGRPEVVCTVSEQSVTIQRIMAGLDWSLLVFLA